MKVTVYGGIGEIGGNKILVESEGTRVFLDFGMSFSRHGAFFDEYLQARPVLRDYFKLGLLPELDGIYREDLIRPANWRDATAERDWPEPYWSAPVTSGSEALEQGGKLGVDAVVLTHAHADHVNDIAYLDPRIPVHANQTTKSLVNAISDVGMNILGNQFFTARLNGFKQAKAGTFPGAWSTDKDKEVVQRPYVVQPELAPFTIGALTFTLVPVDHSVPGACAIHVKDRAGKTLFYTGDIRFHGRLVARQKALRDFATGLQPDLLLCEGTRIGSDAAEDQDSEAGVEDKLTDTITDASGLAFVDFAWKDTTRFDTLVRVAERTGRTLVVPPKLSYLLHVMKRDGVPTRAVADHSNVHTYVDRSGSRLLQPTDYSGQKWKAGLDAEWPRGSSDKWSDEERARRLAHLTSGKSALDVAAHPDRYVLNLSFFELTDLFDLDPPPGSVYLRCACEPFNDEMESDQLKTANWIKAFGMNAEVGGELLKAHASGHGAGFDLKPFAKSIEAARLLPIHTTDHAAFAGLAKDVVEWAPRPLDPVVVQL